MPAERRVNNTRKPAAAPAAGAKPHDQRLQIDTTTWQTAGVDIDGASYPYKFDVPLRTLDRLRGLGDDDLDFDDREKLIEEALDVCLPTLPAEVRTVLPTHVRSQVVVDWLNKMHDGDGLPSPLPQDRSES